MRVVFDLKRVKMVFLGCTQPSQPSNGCLRVDLGCFEVFWGSKNAGTPTRTPHTVYAASKMYVFCAARIAVAQKHDYFWHISLGVNGT